jgi:hypothetical protein
MMSPVVIPAISLFENSNQGTTSINPNNRKETSKVIYPIILTILSIQFVQLSTTLIKKQTTLLNGSFSLSSIRPLSHTIDGLWLIYDGIYPELCN